MAPRLGLNQDMITDKALEMAEQNGMETVTMANIARAFSIKSPSLYNHFKNLNEMKQAMAVKAQKQLYEALQEATLHQTEATLKQLGRAYITFANEHPGLYEASIMAPDPHTDQSFSHAIFTLMKEPLSQYELDDEDTIHLIRGLRSLYHGLVDLNRKEGFKIDLNIEDSLDLVIETFLNGLDRKEG